MKKRITRILGLAMVASLAAACSVGSTQPDQVALHYRAGAFRSTAFSSCIPPSSREMHAVGHRYYYYPAGQRTYDFSGDQGAETGAINIVSSDNQELSVAGGLTFSLDTSCAMLKRFHEAIGIKYQAYMNGDQTSPGWDEMLRFYLGQPLRQAMTTAAQRTPWLALYNDPAARVQFESEVKSVLPGIVKATTGGQDYFSNFNLILQKPQPNAQLVNALTAAQVAIAQQKAVLNQNLTVQTELEQIKALTNVLGPYGYILYKALQDCSAGGTHACPAFLPVPQGANIQVPSK